MAFSNIAMVLCFFMAINMALPTLATVYTVGDSEGWGIGVDYSTWTSGKTFVIGDRLVFLYGAIHTVDEVAASDYNSCTTGNPISSDSSGATTITLTTPGPRYFISATLGDCPSGMRLAVKVEGGSTASFATSSSEKERVTF